MTSEPRFADNFTEEEKQLIAQEQALHERVKEAVKKAALEKMPDMEGIKSRLIELRDEAIHASERDLPSLFQMLNTHHSLAARDFSKSLPDMRAPYFGRMVLLEDGRKKTVLIGYKTFLDHESGVTIVDWRHAAIAKVFFNYREGDDYEVELPGRFAEGQVLERRLIAFEVGELTGITGPEFAYYRPRGGSWAKTQGGAPKLAAGARKSSGPRFGTGGTKQGQHEISSLLDPEQYQILTRDAHEPLLVMGGAGCGKTTVALHRISQIHYNNPQFFSEDAMAVIVPEQGLVRLSERLLRNLGLKDVPVTTFDSWVVKNAKRVLRKVPTRLCQETPGEVIMIKRHPVMSRVIKEYVREVEADLRERFAGEVTIDPAILAGFDAGRPLIARLARVLEQAEAKNQPESVRIAAKRFGERAFERLSDWQGVRGDIFTKQSMQDIMRTADEIQDGNLKELSQHCRRQFTNPDGLSDHDRSTIKEVDGGDIAEDDYYQTIDVEDFTILLLYVKAIAGRVEYKGRRLTELSHVLIDEAQDLSILETELIGDALKAQASVTIAGDPAQQSDPSVQFTGWDDMFKSLGLRAVAPTHLKTNYRCPGPIAEYGHKVLGPLAPEKPPKTLRDGVPVLSHRYANQGLGLVAIAETLEDLLREEPRASIAIIARTEESALTIYDGLKSNLDVRLVLDGEFNFLPGIDVTILDHVKGLEFDYVIIPDASIAVYPDTNVARRGFHIAVTRAIHQLWVQAIGIPSPILPSEG